MRAVERDADEHELLARLAGDEGVGERVVHAATSIVATWTTGTVISIVDAEHDVGRAARLVHADRRSRQLPVLGRRGGRARAGATRLGQTDAALVHLHRELARLRSGDDELDVDSSGYEIVDPPAAGDEVVVTLRARARAARGAGCRRRRERRAATVIVAPVGFVVADLGDAHVDGGTVLAPVRRSARCARCACRRRWRP